MWRRLPEHCTRTDEEAGSIVLHVGHDMTEKKKNDRVNGVVCYEDEIMMEFKQETSEAAPTIKTLESNVRSQRKTWKSEDLSRREESHPKRRNNY